MRPKTDIITLKVYPKEDASFIRKLDKKMAWILPVLQEGYFWFISAKEQVNECVIEYTLTKPCESLDEWELEHKPQPKINPSNIVSCELKAADISDEYNDLMECKLTNHPAHHNGFWWTVDSVVHERYASVFTLVDPVKDKETKVDMMTRGDGQDNPRGIISKAPVNPKRDIIYIAGAISGSVIANRHRFAAAKHNILASSNNATVMNPAELPDGLTQAQYMSICLPMVMASDTVYMLVGWEKSKGAVAEHALAEKLNINIEYQRQPGE